MTDHDLRKHDEARREKKRLDELESNPIFLAFLTTIAAQHDQAAANHEDGKRTPAERAEWLYAMKNARALGGWVAEKKAAIAAVLNRQNDD